MQPLEGRTNNQITGVKDLNVRDHYAAEARDEHLTERDVYNYSSRQSQNQQISFENKRSLKQSSRLKKKLHNPYVSFDIVTFAIYGNNNNGNMVVGEILEFFQFPKRDISTARCKCTIYIFTYKGIKLVIRTEFINMTVLLSMQAFFFFFFFF